jgi:hypothetical protein
VRQGGLSKVIKANQQQTVAFDPISAGDQAYQLLSAGRVDLTQSVSAPIVVDFKERDHLLSRISLKVGTWKNNLPTVISAARSPVAGQV